MSERKPHIEEWLRQAAEQTPEVTPVEVKQQAWDQLNNMLDTVPRLRNSSGFGWWIFIGGILLLVAAVAYLKLGGSFQGKEQKAAAQDAVVRTIDHPSIDSPGDAINGIQNQDAALNTLSGSDGIAQQNRAGDSDVNNAEQQNALSGTDGKQNSNTNRVKQQNGSGNKQLNSNSSGTKQQNTLPSAGGKQQNSNTNRVNQQNTLSNSGGKQQKSKGASTSASYWNTDPLEGNASREQKNKLFAANNGRRGLSSDAPETMKALFTKQLFTPIKDSGLKNIPANKTPRPEKESTELASGFSIRIAAIAPIAEAYGAALNIEYTFKWRNKWRIRPYAGAEYLTGFNKTYDHRYFTAVRGGVGNDYTTDSIITHYVLKGLLYGKAGVQAVYAFPKWEISAGVEYRYLLKAFGKDTFARSSIIIIGPPIGVQEVRFNKKQVTGTGNLRVQVGLDYRVTPRLQIGAIYYLQLNPNKLDSTYNFPHAKLPDQTSLQIHARYFLRKR